MPTSSPDTPTVVCAQHEPSWRLTTKLSRSGAWFLRRRLEHAMVRRNTAMRGTDEIRFYSWAHTLGGIATAVICLAALLLAYNSPLGAAAGNPILQDRTTGQLFVDINQITHPVLNLTSARLITGHDAFPQAVKSSELSARRRGAMVGIPGAPYDTPAADTPDSDWSVCDIAAQPHATHRHPRIEVAVLADRPTAAPDSTVVTREWSLLASYRDTTYLIDAAGRHVLDRSNSAVMSAVDLPADAEPTPLSEALFNALPAAQAFTLPAVAHAGEPNTAGLSPDLVIGTVVTDTTAAGTKFYLISDTGLAPINPATATALRNQDSHGHIEPPALAADVVSAAPQAAYDSPLHHLIVADRTRDPVVCWSWTKTPDAEPVTTTTVSAHLPLTPGQLAAATRQITTDVTVYQTGAGRDGQARTGRYVAVINPGGEKENSFYIDPMGVRYGIGDPEAAAALGLPNPRLAPWPVIRLLAAGPDLSAANALLAHDTLPADPQVRAVPTR